jgi:hypothetical protein
MEAGDAVGSAGVPQDVGELIDGPVEFGLLDDQRRSEPDRGTVGVLSQHAAVGQGEA